MGVLESWLWNDSTIVHKQQDPLSQRTSRSTTGSPKEQDARQPDLDSKFYLDLC